MSRRQDHNQHPESSRNWSEEAVRGSWDSNYQRAMSANTSPRDQSQAWRRPSPNSYDRRQTMVNQWLGQQYTHDPSMAVDAVSNFTTPETSPAISDSATFASRTQEPSSYQTHAVSNVFLAPGSRNNVPYRPYDNRRHSAQLSSRDQAYSRFVDSRQADSRYPEQDLRGVGAFADNDRSRREVKYKPLSNWFGLWLPPHE
ncbi:hypothetical protein F66182_8153 [Fusarium sp. NRRL 66182]|nr:hypothetical protein F66182_8153 [Fusarium sp. NRRL 66182]